VLRTLAAPALAAALLAPSAAWGKNLVGTAGADRIVGTAADDLIRPNAGADFVDARGGNDRVVAPADDASDAVNCGDGRDLALVDAMDAVAGDCETVARQLSRDATSDFRAQHETEVEPDSFSFGRTVVVAYQSGRFGGGGAAGLGWATSRDAGATWRSGALDTGFAAVSDPSVAYDAVHATWLIAFLALTGRSVDVFVSRSADGLAWSTPVPVAPPDSDADKEWIVCDNGGASRFRGRCYVSYLDTAAGALVTRRSTDGGRTWSDAAATSAGLAAGTLVNGAVPVVRPNGDLVVLFTVFAAFGDLTGDWVGVTRSSDGGASFSTASRVAALEGEDVLGLRAPPLVSADVDATGAIVAVWSDCRFRDECAAADVVLATSRDGLSWAPPVRVPAVDRASRVDAFVPAVATAPGGRLAVVYYSQPQPDGCAVAACQGLDAWLLTRTGTAWSTPLRLSPQAMPLAWLADGGLGAMVGDYVSVSWAGGRPVAAVALATAPETGALREAVCAVTPT
jgi:hypothetical protein